MTKRPAPADVEYSSGNIFRDLGFEHPDEELAKVKLIARLRDIVATRGWTQCEAARVLGVAQPKVSLLLRGFSSGFSTGRLMTLLTRAGQDVEIILRPVRGRGRRARVRVLAPKAGLLSRGAAGRAL